MPWYNSEDENKQISDANFTLWMIGFMIVLFIIFYQFNLYSMGMCVWLVIAMKAVVIRSNWKLRKHAWLWLSLVLLFPIEITIIYKIVPHSGAWPRGLIPCIGFSDYFLNFVVIILSKKLFLSDRADEDDNEDTNKDE